MAKLFDRAGQQIASFVGGVGTGNLNLGSALPADTTNGDIITLAAAGAVSGDSINYLIQEGSKWEIGTGALSGTSPTFVLARGPVKTWDGTTAGTTTALTFTTAAKVYCVPANGLSWNLSGPTVTADDPFTVQQTWNNIAVQFTAFKVNATKTSELGDSNGNFKSFLIDLQTGGVTKTNVNRDGSAWFANEFRVGGTRAAPNTMMSDQLYEKTTSGSGIYWSATAGAGTCLGSFTWQANNTLALNNAGNAQTLQVYGSSDNGQSAPSTNYSRLSLKHAGGLLGATIATEAGGTGTAGSLTLAAGGGNVSCVINNATSIDFNCYGGPYLQIMNTGATRLASASVLQFSTDTGLARNAAGVVEINNGTAGTYRAIKAASFLQAQGTLTDAASIVWDVQANQSATVTLGATIGATRALANPTNMVAGTTYCLIVKQDATGSRALTYGTAYKWPGGTAPTLSTAANAVDILTFVSDGTNMYGVAQKAFA